MNRLLLALFGLALLAVAAGCTSPFGSGEVDQAALAQNETYDWNTTANTTLTVESDRLLAVYTLENRSTLEVYAFQRFNNERPVDPVAARFRYPNGTVVGPEAMTFSRANSRTVIDLPARDGQVAMTLPKTGKRLRLPVVVEGSHELILPPDTQARYFLLGRVLPTPDEQVEGPDGRVHLRWDDVTRDRIVVRYYLERDLVVFTAVVVIAGAAIAGGLVFFWLQLRTLRERRQEVAWDDDSGST